MKAKQEIFVNIYISVLAALVVCVDQLIKVFMPFGQEVGLTYLSFIAFAVYFFTCSSKDGFRAWLAYVIGISFSILIVYLAGALGGIVGAFMMVPAAVFFVVFFVLYLAHTKWCNYLPAMFVASGTFFGMINYTSPGMLWDCAIVELIYSTIGLLFGWFAVTGKGVIEAAVAAKCNSCK